MPSDPVHLRFMSELMATQCRQRAEGVLVLVEVNGRWLWMCVRACVVVDVVVDAGEYKGSKIVIISTPLKIISEDLLPSRG